MNGYNKDAKTFDRNARITEVTVYSGRSFGPRHEREKIGTYRLVDRMGWQVLKIPANRYRTLRIEVTGIRHGTEPDVAISELQLLSRGKSVGPGKSDSYIYNAGDECGCGSEERLVAFDGKVLAQTSVEGVGLTPDPAGRYFAGASYREASQTVQTWVYDARLRRKVWERVDKDSHYPTVTFDKRGRLREVKYGNRDEWLSRVLWTPPKR